MSTIGTAISVTVLESSRGTYMPWHTTADVARHNKHVAKDPVKARKWRRMANALLRDGHSEGSAIRIANSHFESGRGKKLYDGKDRK